MRNQKHRGKKGCHNLKQQLALLKTQKLSCVFVCGLTDFGESSIYDALDED